MTVLDLAVGGMTCEHCVRAIKEAVGTLPGVSDVLVDLAGGHVRVTGEPNPASVREAIEAEGYTVG